MFLIDLKILRLFWPKIQVLQTEEVKKLIPFPKFFTKISPPHTDKQVNSTSQIRLTVIQSFISKEISLAMLTLIDILPSSCL
jgi:hypothetical protein